jgi:hypothetical protein
MWLRVVDFSTEEVTSLEGSVCDEHRTRSRAIIGLVVVSCESSPQTRHSEHSIWRILPRYLWPKAHVGE